ncbi:MAG: hypothetical protein ACPG8W_14920 [Candidatus Promineifilaceae bacterium]
MIRGLSVLYEVGGDLFFAVWVVAGVWWDSAEFLSPTLHLSPPIRAKNRKQTRRPSSVGRHLRRLAC